MARSYQHPQRATISFILSVLQDAKQYYKDYKEMKIREKEEVEAMALAEQDATTISKDL